MTYHDQEVMSSARRHVVACGVLSRVEVDALTDDEITRLYDQEYLGGWRDFQHEHDQGWRPR